MVRIALIEDEKQEMEKVNNYLAQYFDTRAEEYNLVWFDEPTRFLEGYTALSYDLILMDIRMPGINGLQAAHALRKMDKEVPLIFVTNIAQLAIRGYEVNAADFMVKPLTYHDFALKLSRVMKKINSVPGTKITVMNKDKVKLLPIKEIIYIDVIEHQLTYHTVDGNFSLRGTLRKAEEDLARYHFCRCNNYCLINLKYVLSVNGWTVTVSGPNGKEEIQISHPRKREFVNTLNEFLGQRI